MAALLAALVLPSCTVDRVPAAPAALEPVIAGYRIAGVRGPHVVCAHHTYGADDSAHPTEVYAWVVCEAYSAAGQGDSASLPVRLHVREDTGRWRVTGVDEPRDGSGHEISIRAMFPESVADEAVRQSGEQEAARRADAQIPREYRHFPPLPTEPKPTG
jgi:hypothetical protein